jgi:type I restriction-modification system DNA methylase subunit
LVANIQKEIERKKYSAKLFDNGLFWIEHPDLINKNNSPYKILLDGLLAARKDLATKYSNKNALKTISKLLIMSILVRYLEEKKDEAGKRLFDIERDFIKQFKNCNQYTDVLREGFTIRFFELLAEKFNGKIFDLSQEDKKNLSEIDLNYIAAILDGNLESRSKQFVLWELYSFNHLPIELISGIYEAFLAKEGERSKDIVYTPPYLVNFMIDECMPLDKAEAYFANEQFKILDPACGSGIFLVAALKRMIQWKAILTYKQTGKIEYPDIEMIKRITKNNIFGVDTQEEATLISVFSLCIVLCDKLSPMEIWHKLRFDDLSEQNIQWKNFFQFYNEVEKESFDLVIGNPPFNPPKGENNKSLAKKNFEDYKTKSQFPIHDENPAIYFLDKGIELCKKETGRMSLVLPAGALLYNNNALSYRAEFLEKYQLSKIYDFTHLSDVLFHGSANVAVCTPVFTNKTPDFKQNLQHIVVQRAKIAEERFTFEIDHYDFHRVAYSEAIENQYVWKANLLGGGRLLRLIDYLSNLRSLGEFLESKKRDGWVYGEGYIVGHDGTRSEEELIEDGFSKAEWVTNKNTIMTDSFLENNVFDIEEEPNIYFRRPRNKIKKIFEPPHIIIKENLGTERIPMVFSEEYLCFTNRFVGIHAPKLESKEIKDLYLNLQKRFDINRLFSIASSSQAGITMSSKLLMKDDIMNLPYPKNPQSLELGKSEQMVVDDVLNYYINSNKSSAKSPLNQDIEPEELENYGEAFCDILNPIYQKDEQEWFVNDFYTEDSLTTFVFCYGQHRPDKVIGGFTPINKAEIESLIYNDTRRNARIIRVMRSYHHINGYDVLVLRKPTTKRYWLQSIALRDADETFADLKKAGF